jgi:signal transduction histidine kinase
VSLTTATGPLLATSAATWVVAAAVGVTGTLLAGFALRRVPARSRSLRATLLLVSLAALLLAVVVAVVAARLMVVDDRELRSFLVILAVAAGFATLLAVIIGGPVAADVSRLAEVATQVERGDLSARTGLVRRDEIGRAAHALDQAVGRLAELERERAGVEAERRVVLTSIGHDLRTPLAALRAAVEALADGVVDDPQRYLLAMQHDVVALGTLVDDLFLLARIESGAGLRERVLVDLAELADEAIEALTPVADDRGVELRLEVEGDTWTAGSPAELGRVIRNLLDNAIRHAPEGTGVVVHVDAPDDAVHLTVRDQGSGFPPEFVADALTPFTRADAARSRTTGGGGLGLAIARGLVEAHGGRLGIEAGPGGTVVVTVPGAATRAESGPRHSRRSPDGARG